MSSHSRAGRIAHILPFPAVGGTEIATQRVARAAREYGYESLIYHLSDAEPVRELFATEFATRAFEPIAPSYRTPRAFIGNSLSLARRFREEKVTLVHCADILGAYLAGYAARLARVPLLCHVRNRYDRISARDRSFLLPVQKFAFVSRDTWTHFAYRVREDRGSVLYDGIDLPKPGTGIGDRESVRAEFDIPAEAPVIGMVARVAPQKDFPTLVRAAAEVVQRFPTARFLIVGDCSSTPALQDHLRAVRGQIEALGLTQNFIFTDYRSDVPRFFNAMDLFVLSTHWEGLPLVLLEAMAHALPVVATAVDGVPEIVVEGRTGLLCAHEDAAGLADRLCSLLASTNNARRLGDAGRDQVAANFSRESFARNLVDIYASICDGPRPSRVPKHDDDRGALAVVSL